MILVACISVRSVQVREIGFGLIWLVCADGPFALLAIQQVSCLHILFTDHGYLLVQLFIDVVKGCIIVYLGFGFRWHVISVLPIASTIVKILRSHSYCLVPYFVLPVIGWLVSSSYV